MPKVEETPVDVQEDIPHNFSSQTPHVALLPSLFNPANKIYHMYLVRCTSQYSEARVHWAFGCLDRPTAHKMKWDESLLFSIHLTPTVSLDPSLNRSAMARAHMTAWPAAVFTQNHPLPSQVEE